MAGPNPFGLNFENVAPRRIHAARAQHQRFAGSAECVREVHHSALKRKLHGLIKLQVGRLTGLERLVGQGERVRPGTVHIVRQAVQR